MRRRAPFGAVLAAVLLLAAPAAGDPGSDKARIDGSIGDLQSRIDRAGRQAEVLTSEISAVTAKARGLQQRVEAQEALLGTLEAELAASRARLSRLDARLQEQARRLKVLEGQYAVALERLERRVREIYETDSPDALSFALGASSFSDVLDTLELLNRIGRQDERIAATVKRTTEELARTRTETKRDRAGVKSETRAIAQRTDEQRGARDRLAANRDALLAAERDKQTTLASITEDRAEFVAEVAGLQAQSAALAARIAAAQAAAAQAAAARAAAAQASGEATATAPTPSAGGFAWPVNGPVTSGFGVRWGRMHEGIDIAVPSGTPVRAAAAGTVIEAGWVSGYGNLVVVDHGNGIATAYAHNSAFAAAAGRQVAQGEVIAYSGSTGHSTGPHVHFEVRVGGAAVDPLGYL
jgi:murein DD-endopeptidase MepM/ murein hydrolase activator NlpD